MIGAGAPRPGRPFVTEAGSVPMNPKFESTLTPSLKRMIALCAIAVALAACSRDLSAQSTGSGAGADAAPGACAAAGAAAGGAAGRVDWAPRPREQAARATAVARGAVQRARARGRA